jgi:hypothetical protein
VGALTKLGVPESAAQHFEAGFRAGGALITVDAGERAAEVLDLLKQYGGDPGPMEAVSPADRPTTLIV